MSIYARYSNHVSVILCSNHTIKPSDTMQTSIMMLEQCYNGIFQGIDCSTFSSSLLNTAILLDDSRYCVS
jgi:hypothetical protein